MAQGGKRAGAGRPKGSANKTTATIREAFAGHFAESMPKIMKALESLESEPEKYLTAWSKFLPYFSPRLQSIDVKEKTTLEEFLLLSEPEQIALIAELEAKLKK